MQKHFHVSGPLTPLILYSVLFGADGQIAISHAVFQSPFQKDCSTVDMVFTNCVLTNMLQDKVTELHIPGIHLSHAMCYLLWLSLLCIFN